MTVGFVGVGRMGAPMVRRLIGVGYEVRALGRTGEKRLAAEDLGAAGVGDVEQVGRDADAVIVCVFTDEQVRQICLEDGLLDAMAAGSVLVVHTTGSPRSARAIAERAAAHGVAVVDAPVSGGPHDVAAGTVTVFAGGEDDAIARVRPLLGSYADPVLHVGGVGAGQKVKLINNILFAANIGLVAEAVRLGERLGVDEANLLAALPHGSGTSRALASIAATGSVSAFAAAVGEFIGKDVSVIRSTAADLGSELGLLSDVVDAGLGQE